MWRKLYITSERKAWKRKRYSQQGAYKKDTASGEKAKVNCADNRL